MSNADRFLVVGLIIFSISIGHLSTMEHGLMVLGLGLMMIALIKGNGL